MSDAVATLPNNARTHAMLRAVAEGRAELTTSCEPDMFVDGLACCDQLLAHQLIHNGLIRTTRFSVVPGRNLASLTRLGFEALLHHVPGRTSPATRREAG